EAATTAAAAATDAANTAAATATEAATDAAAAATEAATNATEAAADAVATTVDAFNPANFDAAKLNGMIDAAPLDDATKSTLKAAVDGAAKNPALVDAALKQVKSALGM
ncbi:MAG TPA: hypothetical protein PLH11_08840, partial [Gemmobacter sp.]|nr:hypothetical protein [Gemmobacter sp.]